MLKIVYWVVKTDRWSVSGRNRFETTRMKNKCIDEIIFNIFDVNCFTHVIENWNTNAY